MKRTSLIQIALFITLLFLTSCLDENEQKDKVVQNEVELFIGSETIKFPIGELFPHRDAVFMTVEDKTFNKSFQLETSDIEGFEYEDGYEYELKAMRTLMLNPPADALNPYYSLIEIISIKKVD